MSCFEVTTEKLKEKLPEIKEIMSFMKGPEFQEFAQKMMEHPSTRVDYLRLMGK